MANYDSDAEETQSLETIRNRNLARMPRGPLYAIMIETVNLRSPRKWGEGGAVFFFLGETLYMFRKKPNENV